MSWFVLYNQQIKTSSPFTNKNRKNFQLGSCPETNKNQKQTNKPTNNYKENILQQLKEECFFFSFFFLLFLCNKKSSDRDYQPRVRTQHYPPGSWFFLSQRLVIFSVLAFVLMAASHCCSSRLYFCSLGKKKGKRKIYAAVFVLFRKNKIKFPHDNIPPLADLYLCLLQQN